MWYNPYNFQRKGDRKMAGMAHGMTVRFYSFSYFYFYSFMETK